MKTDELMEMIEDRILQDPKAKAGSFGDLLYLSIPEPKNHNGYRVRLFGNCGPLATIICGSHGRLTVNVSARRLRAYLKKSAS